MAASGYPGFDGLIDAFANADREALYAFSAVLQGWLSQEHKADGTHSAITADSAVIQALSIGTIDRVRMKDSVGSFALEDFATIGLGGGETKTEYSPPGGIGSTADWVERGFRFDRDLIPSSDGGAALGYVGTTVRRWKYGLFRDFVRADELWGVNGISERTYAARMGEWTTFTPTQTATAGTWTGSTITTAQYMLVGKTLFVQFAIDSGNNSAATANLIMAIPGGFVAKKFAQVENVVALDLGAAITDVAASVTASGTTISFVRTGGANWSINAANGNLVRGLIFFEVQ